MNFLFLFYMIFHQKFSIPIYYIMYIYCINDKKLPLTLSMLINLHTLTLDYNVLNEFPKILCELTSLSNLNVSCNNIRSLPPEIERLSLLQVRIKLLYFLLCLLYFVYNIYFYLYH